MDEDDDIGRLVEDLKLTMIAMVDAAGGEIRMLPRHRQRAPQGIISSYTDPSDGALVYRYEIPI